MTTRKKISDIAKSLTITEGVVLRYLCSPTVELPVEPTRVINHIEWSPIPKSLMEAKRVLESLVELKLAKRTKSTNAEYNPTDKGHGVVMYADQQGLWRAPIKDPPLAPKYIPKKKSTPNRKKKVKR